MHTYTEEQKARIRGMIEAFEGCREFLARNVAYGRGICAALSDWYNDAQDRTDLHLDAYRLVARALGHHPYLEEWQRLDWRAVSYETRLANRHAWLDKLIADCKTAL